VNIFTDSGAANHLDLNIYNGATLVAHVRFPLAASGSLDAAAHVWVWIVLNVGDSIKVQAGAATVYYVISGAELVT
jgi:hypothetical protein